jgi:hypothetical protein
MTEDTPKLQTIRQIAKSGLMPEHALRLLIKQGKLPVLYINSKALLDITVVIEYVKKLSEENLAERRENR